ncbi:MAG: hypothetical protein WC712_03135 [Candidatus Brocadiia bacterium]
MSDEKLALFFRTDDRAVAEPIFDEIYSDTNLQVLKIALLWCKNRADADEVVNLTYSALWEKWVATRNASVPKMNLGFLYHVAVHKAVDAHRAERCRSSRMAGMDAGLMDSTFEGRDGHERRKALAAIYSALEELDPEDRKMLSMELAGVTDTDASLASGVSRETYRLAKERAKAKLGRLLELREITYPSIYSIPIALLEGAQAPAKSSSPSAAQQAKQPGASSKPKPRTGFLLLLAFLAALVAVFCVTVLYSGTQPAIVKSSAPAATAMPTPLDFTGSCATWGANFAGQLGTGQSGIPARYLPDVMIPAAAYDEISSSMHNLAIGADGSVFSWGDNQRGQLGRDVAPHDATAQRVEGLAEAKAVSAGYMHSLALMADGSVYAWGAGTEGQLGNAKSADSLKPVRVSGLPRIVAISAGGDHSLALAGDGRVFAWGANAQGQLGDGTIANNATPIEVAGISGIRTIGTGLRASFAVDAEGRVWAWGDNAAGQLGDGSNTGRNRPTPVVGIANCLKVCGGDLHSVALTGDGSVYAWGEGLSGQLGLGATQASLTPVRIASLAGIADIATKKDHTLALDKSGTLWAWGRNTYSQLGDSSVIDRDTPIRVMAVSKVGRISTGFEHSVALYGAELQMPPLYGSRLTLDALQVNGIDYALPSPVVRVRRGERLTGTMTVLVDRRGPAIAILPIGGTISWDRSYRVQVFRNLKPGEAVAKMNLDVSAPAEPGEYWIIILADAVWDFDELFGRDHTTDHGGPDNGPFGNGNDVWDWTREQFEQAARGEYVDQIFDGAPYRSVALAVKVVVE